MLNANELQFRNEQGIFPLIVFKKRTQSFKCIGTTFFINGLGIFVTAKHVIEDEVDEMIIVLQCLSDNKGVSRIVTNLCIHPYADIAVGLVGPARHPLTAKLVDYEMAPNCRLSFLRMDNGTSLMGFGYPRIEKTINANLTTFHFLGTWSKGFVEDFHEKGTAILRNKCYQTTMRMDSGCSGGPVFKDGCVVGINSSSFEMTGEEKPISFITPVEYVLDLQLPFAEGLLSIRELIERKAIVIAD